jgi:hypothetical protein
VYDEGQIMAWSYSLFTLLVLLHSPEKWLRAVVTAPQQLQPSRLLLFCCQQPAAACLVLSSSV